MNVTQIGPNHWRVDSETTQGVRYDVRRQGDLWTCDCASCQRGGRRCKHIAAVADCPACHGRGFVEITSFVWYEADGERAPSRLPCAICEGSRQPPSSLPSQDELLRIFG